MATKHKFDAELYPALAAMITRRGAFEDVVAIACGDVTLSQITFWKRKYPEFRRAIACGRLAAWKAGLRPDCDPLYDGRARRAALRKVLRLRETYDDERLEELEAMVLDEWEQVSPGKLPLGPTHIAVFMLRNAGFRPLVEHMNPEQYSQRRVLKALRKLQPPTFINIRYGVPPA